MAAERGNWGLHRKGGHQIPFKKIRQGGRQLLRIFVEGVPTFGDVKSQQVFEARGPREID